MKIVITKEMCPHEKRVAISPEITKKLSDLGHDVLIEDHAGKDAGFSNADYEAVGAKIEKNKGKLLKQADVVFQISPLSEEDIAHLSAKTVLMSIMKPYSNGPLMQKIATQKVTCFALELIPRISRAQAMDILSSQSNLAGYKAVVDSAAEYGRAMPMMMTAAGTVPPAKVLVLGAGVAGLQAIATARRMGAVVSAFDVRSSAKEQVESLGAKFIEVDATESGDAAGGYAKEMSDDYKKRQSEKLAETIKSQDIVITTAQIPGKTAPILITEEMVKSMKAGAIIYDLAIESGGNCQLSDFGKTVTKHGVKIIGHANVPARIAQDASQLFSRNIFNFFKILCDKEGKSLALNWDDEILKGSALTHDGQIIHPNFIEKA